ncbi:MAG: hypothetical protein EOO73_07315 [Myxococcales bacterium]|nr:MAG: hypothetical protein EOO73_07315 [Myxococcales bacterium]
MKIRLTIAATALSFPAWAEPSSPNPTPTLPEPAPAPARAAAAPRRQSLAASPVTRGGPETKEAQSSWQTEFHGYFRVPFRVGLGSRAAPRAVDEGKQSEADTADVAPGQSRTTLHAPIIPDGQYLSWQSTSHNRSDWAELFFGIGNAWAKATVGLQGYNFTDASFNDPQTQYGIGQAFVTITPDLGYENLRLSLKVGASQDRYGAAGRYDAGEYDTYLFGRTHVIGETLRAEYDLSEEWTLWLEEGLGGKRPDPSSFNNARFTMLAHGHVGLNRGRDLQFSSHLLYSWAQEEDRPYDVSKQATQYASSVVDFSDGKLWVAGADVRVDLGAWGYLYGGYSHIGAKNALVVGRALEVLHASGGGEYQLGVVDNYFGPGCRAAFDDPVEAGGPTERKGGLAGPGPVPAPIGCSAGTGAVDSVLGQYEFSLTNFLQQQEEGGQKFWGEGADLKLVLYGMLSKVKSDYRPTDKAIWGPTDGITKVKYGADLQYHATPSLTAALRFDRLQPNSEVPEQSFAVLSPRLVFSSNWVTREQLTFQYSRYLYNRRECVGAVSPADFSRLRSTGSALCVQPPPAATPPDGFGINSEVQDGDLRSAPTLRPDLNVFKIEATFWW